MYVRMYVWMHSISRVQLPDRIDKNDELCVLTETLLDEITATLYRHQPLMRFDDSVSMLY